MQQRSQTEDRDIVGKTPRDIGSQVLHIGQLQHMRSFGDIEVGAVRREGSRD
jgi:hypothetical protein